MIFTIDEWKYNIKTYINNIFNLFCLYYLCISTYFNTCIINVESTTPEYS